jgi:hypothetical protein
MPSNQTVSRFVRDPVIDALGSPLARRSPLIMLGLGDTAKAIDARVEGTAARSIIPLHHVRWRPWSMSLCGAIGVNGFRVVDASIIPLPFRAQYHATVDALGERELRMAFR